MQVTVAVIATAKTSLMIMEDSPNFVFSSWAEDKAWLSSCLVGTVKNYDILQNIWNILKAEGWGECKIYDNIQLNVAKALILTHRMENINQVVTAKIDSKVVKIRVTEELLCPIVIDHKSTSEDDADIGMVGGSNEDPDQNKDSDQDSDVSHFDDDDDFTPVMDSDVPTGGAHWMTNSDNVEVHDKFTRLRMAQNSNVGNCFNDDFGKCKDDVNSWGLSAELKQLWLKDIIRDKLLDFVSIQETKLKYIDPLERIISDHCLIFLCDNSINFGPKTFKFFDAWLDHPEFPHLVRQSWLADSGGLSGDVILKNKLKRLKSDLKLWADKIWNEASQRIVDLRAKLMEWDSKSELGLICDEDIHVREADVFELLRLNQYEQSLMKQKSRIKWAIEGDENTKFYHTVSSISLICLADMQFLEMLNYGGGTRDYQSDILVGVLNILRKTAAFAMVVTLLSSPLFQSFKEDERGMSWFNWKTVLSPFNKGGLGIGSIRAKNLVLLGTDKAKITRKRLKPGKHEHGNGRARKKPGGSYQSQTMVKLQSTWSTKVKCMRTRNSYFPNNSNVTIPRRRNRNRVPNIVEPELRTIVEVAPMAERTMEELLRAPTEGYREAIVLPEINADHFEIKTNLLQLVQANPFYGRESENPHAHINSFKRITSTLRFRNVPNDVIKLMMFSYSLEGAAKTWMNATSSKTDERIDKLADQLSTLVEIVSKKVVTPVPVKAVEESCVTCGGAHSWYNCPATDNNQASVCATTGTYNQVNPPNHVSNQMAPLASTSGTLPSNTIPNPKGEMKAITTRSGVAYERPSIPTNPSPKKVVEQETEETTDKEQTNFQGSTAQIPPPVIPILIPEPDVSKTLPKTTPIPKSDIPKSLPKPNIPYPSRRDDQKSRDKALNQMEKIFQIFQDLRFDISFADALLLMPRFAPTIKSLLMNKEKLLELAKIPLNENCSAILLKKLPEKLEDPGKFLIPCNFPGMDVCHALADLGASINLMPLSIWKKLSLPDLTPTRMTLELADRSITYPKGLAEDVFVKVGKFHFPTDFGVVDFEAGPRVPLILGRSFLRIGRALIDVYGEEITLRVVNEAVTPPNWVAAEYGSGACYFMDQQHK
ncbi:reverse transcriptase domain-containing protein, partial [Tanacetum coccineum]